MAWRPSHWWSLALIGFTALLGLLGIFERAGITDLHPQATISEVWVTADGLQLEVIVNTCNANVSAEVEQYDDRVVLRAKNHDRRLLVTGDDDCQDLVPVDLAQPLGSRQVVDTSGEAFVVSTR